ncbi:hypothetical protein BDV36DRAFT_267947, partial [Aspergillus pseudocaelatus]
MPWMTSHGPHSHSLQIIPPSSIVSLHLELPHNAYQVMGTNLLFLCLGNYPLKFSIFFFPIRSQFYMLISFITLGPLLLPIQV